MSEAIRRSFLAASDQRLDQTEADRPKRKKRPSPVSIRLSEDEREELFRRAGRRSVNAYVKEQIFGRRPLSERRSLRSSCSGDDGTLARLLRSLGSSELPVALHELRQASADGVICMRDETEELVVSACRDIQAMRSDLMKALGLRSE